MLQALLGVGADEVGDFRGGGFGDATKDMRRNNEALVIGRHAVLRVITKYWCWSKGARGGHGRRWAKERAFECLRRKDDLIIQHASALKF